MNARLTFVCLTLALCLGAGTARRKTTPKATTRPPPTTPAQGNATTGSPQTPKLWALLVAGSNTYDNYRHQADVCHAYQILHAHGIPDENIIVMMYDDIANSRQNPTKGIIINHPNGNDVYKGVLKDYTGDDVTPDNFINILTGNKEAMKNIGSGKVIESGPNDHVFVNFVDHGATGILGFPNDDLTVKQLNDALKKMHTENRYNKLVLYVEACESGSMFKKVLPDDINIFATTASDYDESSYACYYDSKRRTYLGDWYSVNWMEDSDKEDIEKEKLQDQYQIVQKATTTSHVMEYGDLTIGNSMVVGEFQGEQEAPINATVPAVAFERGVPSLEVPLDILYRQFFTATSVQEKQLLRAQIDNMIEKRAHLASIVNKLVARVATSHEHEQRLVSAKPEQLTQLECHHTLVKAFSRNCFNFGKHTYALKYAYILANMCEQGADAENVVAAMQEVCKDAKNSDRIN